MKSGRLGDLGTAALCRRIAGESRTGCLRLTHGDTRVLIWFHDGTINAADAPGARARLGDRLVGGGHLTPEQLEGVLENQRDDPERRRLGELLIDRGLVERDVVRRVVRAQSIDSVAVALGLVEGEWQFEDGAEASTDTPLGLDVANALVEGARRLGQWEAIRASFGSLDVVVDLAADHEVTNLQLMPDEWSLLTHIDGRSTVAEIAEYAGYGQFETARIIYGLHSAGIVKVLRDSSPAPPPEPATPEDAEPAAPPAEGEGEIDAIRRELMRLGVGTAEPAGADEPADDSREDTDTAAAPAEDRDSDPAVDREALLREISLLDDLDD